MLLVTMCTLFFKAKMKSSLFDEVIPKQLEYLNNLLLANNGGKGYFVGDKVG